MQLQKVPILISVGIAMLTMQTAGRRNRIMDFQSPDSTVPRHNVLPPGRASKFLNGTSAFPPDLTRDQSGGDDGGEKLPDGWTCMKKVMMEEETEWDTEEQCHHVTSQNCYQTFKTEFKPQKVEKCDEKFRKDCFITYKDIVKSETVQICDEEIRRNCHAPNAKEVCSTQYETVCETKYKEYEVKENVPDCRVMKVPWCEKDHNGEDTEVCYDVPKNVCEIKEETLKKVVPKTDCNARPRKVCGPETCPLEKGERKCRDEIKHLVQEVPQEECNMIPQQQCTDEVQIIPSLVPHEKCVDVPKEVCTTARVNPRKVMKPVIKRWCGPISEEGEADCSNLCPEIVGASTSIDGFRSFCKEPDNPTATCQSICSVMSQYVASKGYTDANLENTDFDPKECDKCALAGCGGSLSDLVACVLSGGRCTTPNNPLDSTNPSTRCPGLCDESSGCTDDSCRSVCRSSGCPQCYSLGCTDPASNKACSFAGACTAG